MSEKKEPLPRVQGIVVLYEDRLQITDKGREYLSNLRASPPPKVRKSA